MGRSALVDIALALLILWALLFIPVGLVIHQLVLGEGARKRALPLAPLTGMAVAFVVLTALGRSGIDAGDDWVPWLFVGAAFAAVVYIWRAQVQWRSRELIGSSLLLLFAVLLLQASVLGGSSDGPLGYGTTGDPVREVAAIDADAHGSAARLEVARDQHASAGDRPIAFEQFAAMTVAIGRSDDRPASADATWTAYSLHAPITSLFAILTLLPLFAFARARGMRTFGLIVLVPLGALAPAVFLAVANGAGAAVSTVPFTSCAIFSLLVARRDRGWWSLTLLFGAAVAVAGGILALFPLVIFGIGWMFLRATTYEHLSEHDTPVGRTRALALAVIAAGLGAWGVASTIGGEGELLAWQGLHGSLGSAIRSWPFTWLDPDLGIGGPTSGIETAVWLIGPVLLVVALIFAIERNERRELGVLVGTVSAAVLAVVVALADRSAGIRLLEYTLLVTSPMLAALALRAVALAREGAEERRAESGVSRLSGVGPTVLVCVFAVLCIAATGVTGSRMVHAPTLRSVGANFTGSTLIAGGDKWLAFIVDGDRVCTGAGDTSCYADADQLAAENPRGSVRSIAIGDAYDNLILSSTPLGSDPSLRYLENSELDDYQVRLFYDLRGGGEPPRRDIKVDNALAFARAEAQKAGRATSTDDPDASAAADSDAAVANPPVLGDPLRHTPVEQADDIPADRPAGLLLPSSSIDGCSVKSDQLELSACRPEEPVVGDSSCTNADIDLVGKSSTAGTIDVPVEPTDEDAAATADGDAAPKQPGGYTGDDRPVLVSSDDYLPTNQTLLGVQCFDVDLAEGSDALVVHTRDVGVVLAPEDAKAKPGDAWNRLIQRKDSGGVNGGRSIATSTNNAQVLYGGNRLSGSYDLTLEGSFGAGVSLASGYDSEGSVDIPNSTSEIDDLRGAADGFSRIERDINVVGNVSVTDRSGTAAELGRLFARPRDLAPSCNFALTIDDGAIARLRTSSVSTSSAQVRLYDGLTVAIASVEETASTRTAHVVVGSYLTHRGLPRYSLVDWTEQYEGHVDVEGCDGVVHGAGATDDAAANTANSASVEDIADSLGVGVD
ncbi:MAG: hypothetical protein JWN72_683 [Thermoleophilia bacterium]|nr:hypothetical protein [Thermoleophilia bacterium]